MDEGDRPGRLPLWIAALLSAVWIGLLANSLPTPGSVASLAAHIPELLAPVAALFAIAAAWMAARPRALQSPSMVPEPMDDAEARLAGSASRIDTLRRDLAGSVSDLGASAEWLEARTGRIAEAARAAASEAERLAAVMAPLDESARLLLGNLAELSADAATRSSDLEQQARNLAGAFADARATGAESVRALEDSIALLASRLQAHRQTEAETVEAAGAAAARHLADAEAAAQSVARLIEGQAGALGAQVADARAMLEGLMAEAGRALPQLLHSIAVEATAVESRLAAQVESASALGDAAERSFQRLEARMAHATEETRRLFDQLGERIEAANSKADAVSVPLRESRQAVGELEAAVSSLRSVALDTVDALGQSIPGRVVEASDAAATMSTEIGRLLAGIDGALQRIVALREPVEASRAALASAADGYAAQRGAIEAAGQALVVELEQARQLIAEVEEATRETSLAAATRLVDAMTRVREVSTQAAGTMRETLAAIVGEAREALASAADSAMRQSFAGPVAAQAEAAEAASRTAAERTAASLAALASTLKLVEQSVGERQQRLDEMLRADLAAAASFLEDRMAAASIRITTAMDKPMSDDDWQAWGRGERGLFNRRAVALLDRQDARALKALADSDPAFAEAARNLIASFDSLLRRVSPEGSGALSRALRNSDTGRMAAALSEALDR